jgi:hypothetical protein
MIQNNSDELAIVSDTVSEMSGKILFTQHHYPELGEARLSGMAASAF